MVSKYEHLMLLGAFSDKVSRGINFTDEAVVQYCLGKNNNIF